MEARKLLERKLWDQVAELNSTAIEKMNNLLSKDFKSFQEEDLIKYIDSFEEMGRTVTAVSRSTSIFHLTLDDPATGRHGIGPLLRGIRSHYYDCISKFTQKLSDNRLKTKFSKFQADFDNKTDLNNINKNSFFSLLIFLLLHYHLK